MYDVIFDPFSLSFTYGHAGYLFIIFLIASATLNILQIGVRTKLKLGNKSLQPKTGLFNGQHPKQNPRSILRVSKRKSPINWSSDPDRH